MPTFRSVARRLGPVFALDVVNDARFRPGEQARNDKTHALAAAGRSESENMLGTVMTEIMEPPERIFVPAANIDPLWIVEETCGSHVLNSRPSGRTVNVFRVLGQPARLSDVEGVDGSQSGSRAHNNDERAVENWLAHSRICGTSVPPDPPDPSQRLVYRLPANARERRAQSWLISEPIGNELRRHHIRHNQQKKPGRQR